MKTNLVSRIALFFIVIFPVYSKSQVLHIEWDNTIGSDTWDTFNDACISADGGYLLGGTTEGTISGDKTENPKGGRDYWIVKINDLGVVQWDKTIGSADHDFLVSLTAAGDGGYVLCGYTTGGVSGDKTDPSFGGRDIWVVKVDASGIIQWQTTLGGTDDEYPTDIYVTPGGGYVISGYSASPASGNKTQDAHPGGIDGYDYWIVKLNILGDISWQLDIGGNKDDYAVKTIRTQDTGFLIAGYSSSEISFEKSESNTGYLDVWLVKIDPFGEIMWDQTIGGDKVDRPHDIVELPEGDFMLVCESNSDPSGDKSEFSYNSDFYYEEYHYPSNDPGYWVLHLDATGNVLSENTIGASEDDDDASDIPCAIIPYGENKYLIAGYSYGGISNSHKSVSKSGIEYWVVSVDTNGLPNWQQVFQGYVHYDPAEFYFNYILSGASYLQAALQTPDGGFLFVGTSNADAAEDKTEDPLGGPYGYYDERYTDFWVIKTGTDTCTQQTVYIDYDMDGHGSDFVGMACTLPIGTYSFSNDDCDDLRSSVYAGAYEICDGVDNDCDGNIDEGIPTCNPGPPVQWDKTYGGQIKDYFTAIAPAFDGGIYIGGYSTSDSLDIDVNYGASDFILMHLGPSGNVIWNSIMGGSNEDRLLSLTSTNDHGVIAAGYSGSGISGTKTEGTHGYDDIWIIKYNSIGVVEWQKDYGSVSDDKAAMIRQTADGGFIIGANSSSAAGYDKSESSYISDYWIVKLDAAGNIEWENTINGNASDNIADIQQTPDGGYIVGGNSRSGVAYDKTEMNYGSDDYWVLKLDPAGNILWQNTINGEWYDELNKILILAEGGYLLVGYSSSDAGGDKTYNSIEEDYWILKLDNAGNVLWDKTIFGSHYDVATDAIQTAEGGYLICGTSDSEHSGYKVEPPINQYFLYDHQPYFDSDFNRQDFWMVYLDTSGNILTQNVLGGNMCDKNPKICIGIDGDIFIGGNSSSHISADKSEDPKQGIYEFYDEDDVIHKFIDTDFWILRLDAGCLPTTEICNAYDDDCNGIIDDGVVESISVTPDGPTVFCQGGSVVLHADYTGTDVQWKKNGVPIPGATSADYEVHVKGYYSCVTTSDCASAESDILPVVVNKNPSAHITAGGPTTFCAGGSVVLSANPGGGLSYQWYSGPTPIPGATSINYTATTASTYKCRVTKTATGCNKLSNGIIVSIPCRNGETITSGDIQVYPNPVEDLLHVVLPTAQENDLFIVNTLGEVVLEKQIIGSACTIPTGSLASGMYFLHITNGAETQVVRFVKD